MLKMMIILSLAAAVLIGGVVLLADSPQTAAKPAFPSSSPMTVEKIAENLYWFKGGVMANAGFYVGEKNVIVIDAKMTEEAAKAMIAAIATITPKPIGTIILTHSDGDHVNGLTAFPRGLRIVASENTKKEMEEAFKDDKMSALRAYLPNVTFPAAKEFRLDLLPARLWNYGPAHTSGDTVILFPKERTAFVGDLVFLDRDPLVHRQKGGTSFGLAKTLQALLLLEADVYISGHNNPLSKTDIQNELTSLQEKQARVKELMAAGKTLDEIKKALGIETPAGGPGRWPSLIDVIYLDLKENRR